MPVGFVFEQPEAAGTPAEGGFVAGLATSPSGLGSLSLL